MPAVENKVLPIAATEEVDNGKESIVLPGPLNEQAEAANDMLHAPAVIVEPVVVAELPVEPTGVVAPVAVAVLMTVNVDDGRAAPIMPPLKRKLNENEEAQAIPVEHAKRGFPDVALYHGKSDRRYVRLLVQATTSMSVNVHELAYATRLGYKQTACMLRKLGIDGLNRREGQVVMGWHIVADYIMCGMQKAQLKPQTNGRPMTEGVALGLYFLRDAALRSPSTDVIYKHFEYYRHGVLGGYTPAYVTVMQKYDWPVVAWNDGYKRKNYNFGLGMRRMQMALTPAENYAFFVQRTLTVAKWLETWAYRPPVGAGPPNKSLVAKYLAALKQLRR